MKMTLDELKVQSYAHQVSENELTEIKGGTYSMCLRAAAYVVSIYAAVNEECDNCLNEAVKDFEPSTHVMDRGAW